MLLLLLLYCEPLTFHDSAMLTLLLEFRLNLDRPDLEKLHEELLRFGVVVEEVLDPFVTGLGLH